MSYFFGRRADGCSAYKYGKFVVIECDSVEAGRGILVENGGKVKVLLFLSDCLPYVQTRLSSLDWGRGLLPTGVMHYEG